MNPSIQLTKKILGVEKLTNDAVEKIMQQLFKSEIKEYGVTFSWEKKTVLAFHATLVNGTIKIMKNQIKIEVYLSFFLLPVKKILAERLEKEIDRAIPKLNKELS